MRDPKRIGRILKKLETAWLLEPDWRLTQLIINISWDNNWNLEDEDLEDMLDNFIKNI